MVFEAVECPTCRGVDIHRHGQSATRKKRYICRNENCTRKTFILNYTYKGHLATVKQQIAEMAINGSGIRDIVRVLGISPTIMINELKKAGRYRSCQLSITRAIGCRDRRCRSLSS